MDDRSVDDLLSYINGNASSILYDKIFLNALDFQQFNALGFQQFNA